MRVDYQPASSLLQPPQLRARFMNIVNHLRKGAIYGQIGKNLWRNQQDISNIHNDREILLLFVAVIIQEYNQKLEGTGLVNSKVFIN
jgi:hypothetical protein